MSTVSFLGEPASLVFSTAAHSHVAEVGASGSGLLPRGVYDRVLFRALDGTSDGRIELHDGQSTRSFGRGGNRAAVCVHDRSFYRRVVSGGPVGAAEAYMKGIWSCDQLTDLFRILLRNDDALQQLSSPLSTMSKVWNQLVHRLRRNSRDGSRRNIVRHYDLGNEFFSLFLDRSMMYSSAIYPDATSNLEEASREKLQRICLAADLRPGDHVLEIGTGWGGFALHAAREFGCRVTTTTISDEQFRMANRRVREAGLQDRITLLKSDYRDLTGQYDKVVSIEMIEAVGREYLTTYFQCCDRLLKPGGRLALQAIVMPEQRFARYSSGVDFIQKFIFPGGFLPSVTSMQGAVASATNLRLKSLTDYTQDYARTLADWDERFLQKLDEVRAQGFDEEFIRMWHYYLCYCAAGFLESATGLVHTCWTKS